jgi:hypothetical protein
MATRKPSGQSSQFQAPKKSTPQEIERGALGIGAQREIAPGVTVSQEISLENLLPSGRVSGAISDTDAGTEISIGIGGKINTPLGRFGITGGGAIEITDNGEVSVKESTVGVEIGGVGVETSVDRKGQRSVSLCYSYAISETCIKLGPAEDTENTQPDPPTPPTPPTPTPLPPPGMPFPPPSAPNLSCSRAHVSVKTENYARREHSGVNAGKVVPNRSSYSTPPPREADTFRIPPGSTAVPLSTGGTRYYYYESSGGSSSGVGEVQLFSPTLWWRAQAMSVSSDSFSIVTGSGRLIAWGVGQKTANYSRETIGYDTNNRPIYGDWILLSTGESKFECLSAPTPLKPISLPNLPQETKPMDKCCELVKEIHKYLGIEKLKRNGFPVSKAFLTPGGTGEEKEFDYYEIMQALFRMLANGLIINPKSKPLGANWQSANATAWASGMYEMMAEAMSDGNSSQRFEISVMMQLVQMMAAIAETSRKVEFVADAIGLEPEPVSEELPVCFTIHESHKGFGKKELEKIDISKAKTDTEVEAILNKMLKPSLVPIIRWQFKPDAISINEALRNG